MNKEKNTIIQEKLRLEKETRFTIKGQTEYDRLENGEWGYVPKTFRVSENGNAIYRDRLFGEGMNVNKWGPTCITLYTFNMLGKKTVGKIKYADVTILEGETD